MDKTEVNLTCFNADFEKTEQACIDFVEKMWRNLRKSLWGSCGKVLHNVVDKLVLHILEVRFARFLRVCGKKFTGFAQRNNRGESEVLHTFHIAYYYNY